MNNNLKFVWGHQRRFNAYSEHIKQKFGGRVQKISVDAGFSCPNRDGSLASGGCTYCNNNAFTPSYCTSTDSLTKQISDGIEFHAKRYRRANKFLVYFQSYTNTHSDLDSIKLLYEEALSYPNVIGLVIGTRPDCMPDCILDYLGQINKQYHIVLEYGVESIYEETLTRINRGHTYEQAVDTIHRTADKGIECGAHFIFGLPGESRLQMLEAANVISQLPLTSIKFHQLQLIKGTKMAYDYHTNPDTFDLFTFTDYVDFIVTFIEHLNPAIVIERFAGEVPPRFLVSPLWSNLRYDQILQAIENKMEIINTWQGKKYYTGNKRVISVNKK